VAAVAYAIESPRDAASGLPTGKRKHEPVTISKAIDQATPQLFQALVTNETLTTVKIEFVQPAAGPTGTPAPTFTITLTNAAISALKSDWSETANAQELEQAQFVYQKIEVTWAPTGKTAIDAWSAQA
jgi:type VI secretion system secreted protein Hcp